AKIEAVAENGDPKRVEYFPYTEEYEKDLRGSDPDAMHEQAIALYETVINDFADVRYIQYSDREALRNHPLYNDRTLGERASAALDDMLNLAAGKPAPEIEGTDMATGKPLKLSDYRGKVVLLVFWGTWCGPCMEAVKHERALAERHKGRPF